MGDIPAAKLDIVEAEDLEETGDELGGASAVKREPLDHQDHEEPQDPKDPQDTGPQGSSGAPGPSHAQEQIRI